MRSAILALLLIAAEPVGGQEPPGGIEVIGPADMIAICAIQEVSCEFVVIRREPCHAAAVAMFHGRVFAQTHVESANGQACWSPVNTPSEPDPVDGRTASLLPH